MKKPKKKYVYDYKQSMEGVRQALLRKAAQKKKTNALKNKKIKKQKNTSKVTICFYINFID